LVNEEDTVIVGQDLFIIEPDDAAQGNFSAFWHVLLLINAQLCLPL